MLFFFRVFCIINNSLSTLKSNFQDGVNKIVSAVNTKAGSSLTSSSTPAQIASTISGISTSVKVIKLFDLTTGATTLNLSGYAGYKNFAVNKNIFLVVTSMYGAIAGAWDWYRPSDIYASISLSYNASTGVLTIPGNNAYGSTLSGYVDGTKNGGASARASISGSVYLVY